VTVCIAAFSTRVNKMVLVSDSKVAFGEFSADKAVVKNVQSTTLRDFTGGVHLRAPKDPSTVTLPLPV
jgi:hypothetical protein